MSQFVITVGDRAYRVSPDDFAASDCLRVWAHGCLRDEVTEAPVRGRVQASTDLSGVIVRVTEDGFFAVAAVARKHLTGLESSSRILRLKFKAPGYLPVSTSVVLPQTPGFPGQLPPPVDLEILWMHREPVVIAGHVVLPDGSPAGGATVRVTGIRLVNSTLSFDMPNLVAVRPPLYFGRATTGANPGEAHAVTLTPANGQDKYLRSSATAGGSRIHLDNRIDLNPAGGDWLEIGSLDPHAAEIIPTSTVYGASTPQQPCEVALAFPLQRSHAQGALVRPLLSTLPGTVKNLTRAAIPGDSVLFLNDLSGWQSASAAAVSGGAPVEHHRLQPFTTTTNQDGFYRLPPINRVAAVTIEVQTATQEWSIDYRQPTNVVNFRL